jgi:hypothetical protein
LAIAGNTLHIVRTVGLNVQKKVNLNKVKRAVLNSAIIPAVHPAPMLQAVESTNIKISDINTRVFLLTTLRTLSFTEIGFK